MVSPSTPAQPWFDRTLSQAQQKFSADKNTCQSSIINLSQIGTGGSQPVPIEQTVLFYDARRWKSLLPAWNRIKTSITHRLSMRNTLSQALKVFFSPETIAPFLLGSVCLAVFGNATYDVLKNSFGSTTPELIRIAVITLFILLFAIGLVSWIITQRLARIPFDIPFHIRQKQLNQQYRGLILLVSRFEACETAIRFHLPRLERCWLICSTQSLEIAQRLCQQFPSVCVDQPILINDVYQPMEVCDRLHEIYRDRLPRRWQESDVIADYTGMTAHASVGVVLACVGTQRPLQYTPAKLDAQGKVIGSLAPIKVLLEQGLGLVKATSSRSARLAMLDKPFRN
jgi:hypothetical protein